MVTTNDKPLLEYGPPPKLLSVILIVNPYDPAGVDPEVVTVKVIVLLLPLGVKVGVVPDPPAMASVPEVKFQVTPVGVPPAHVKRILSESGKLAPLSVKDMV